MRCERTSVELEALEKLKPSSIQLGILSRLYELLERKLYRCLAEKSFKVEIEAEGSYAKRTLLSNKWEVDVFILFNGVTGEWIKSRSLPILEECIKPLPYIVKYAEHPYLTVNLMGMKVELIPAVKVEKPGSGGLGVERTPFHTRYVRMKLDEEPCLRDDIRLLKSFMEGIGVYGAETGIGGFSGYLAELLAIHYGGFRETLKAALGWKPQIYIDPEGVGVEAKLRAKYSDSPMIVVDPVDPERNAAASVTREKLALFILASALYLRKPHLGYFHFMGRRVPEALGPALMVICRNSYSRKPEENVMGKLRRVSLLLSTWLKGRGFKVTWSSFASDFTEKAVVLLGLESLELPEVEYREGLSPWDDVDGAVNFVFKRLREGGVVWVDERGVLGGVRRRPYRRALQAVREVLSRVEEIMDAKECKVLECEEGVKCLEMGGLKGESYIGGPPAWITLAYTLLKQS